MRALSLLQPWASLIAIGAKHYETRSWRPDIRHLGEDVAIHASKRFPKEDRQWTTYLRTHMESSHLAELGPTENLPTGAIVAVGTLVAVMPTEGIEPRLSAFERLAGDYSAGRWAWKFDHVQRLPEPIPCGGALNLWIVPDEMAQAIHDQLAAAGMYR